MEQRNNPSSYSPPSWTGTPYKNNENAQWKIGLFPRTKMGRKIGLFLATILYSLWWVAAYGQTPAPVSLSPQWQQVQSDFAKLQALQSQLSTDLTAAFVNSPATTYSQAQIDAKFADLQKQYQTLLASCTGPAPAPPLPPVVSPTESASGTQVTSTTGKIVDANGDTWTLDGNWNILRDGVSPPNFRWQTKIIVYKNHTVYMQGFAPDTRWYTWTNNAFVIAASPI